MNLTRRMLIYLGTGLGLSTAIGFAVRPHKPRPFARQDIIKIIGDNFGSAQADSPAAAEFSQDMIAAHATDPRPIAASLVIYMYCASTTAIASAETGALPDYLGLFSPYENPCANPLTSLYGPQAS